MENKTQSSNFLTYLLLLVIATIVVLGGINASNALAKKAKEQAEQTDKVNRWKQSYKALEGTMQDWTKTYKAASTVPDVRAIAGLLNLQEYGLTTDPDSIVMTEPSQIERNGLKLDLSKICFGVGSEYFVVRAPTYAKLLEGLQLMAKRPDIHFGSIIIESGTTYPYAKMGDFCVYLRNE